VIDFGTDSSQVENSKLSVAGKSEKIRAQVVLVVLVLVNPDGMDGWERGFVHPTGLTQGQEVGREKGYPPE